MGKSAKKEGVATPPTEIIEWADRAEKPLLTPMQEMFVVEYLVDNNATQAAARAGYKSHNSGTVLMKNPEVLRRIREASERAVNSRVADVVEIREFMTGVMRGEVTEQTAVYVGKGIQDFRPKEAALKDRLHAAEMLGKSYAMFTDNHNLEIKAPVVISGENLLED